MSNHGNHKGCPYNWAIPRVGNHRVGNPKDGQDGQPQGLPLQFLVIMTLFNSFLPVIRCTIIRCTIPIRCALLLCLAPNLYAAEPAYLHTLLDAASAQQLADQREWHILLHYQTSGSGYVSEVDDPRFFTAPHGKTNPQAELAATLNAFFAPRKTTDDVQNQHPQCAFIARYHWLNQHLRFDPLRLPPQACPRFDDWLAELQPAGLSLIFPAAYLNNPSSMFGHTLLRIDQTNQTEKTRILAYALNYAAATDETNGLVFAVKGITGGYPGLFSIMPYYKKVKEYSDLENRDVWEYQLDFSLEEIHRLLRHIWELDDIYFEYYFFDENCAYHLLSLLEAARPTLHLRDTLPDWVIPGETVRTVVATPGLVKKAVFRPASTTQLRYRLQQLSEQQQDWVQTLVAGQTQPEALSETALDVDNRAQILEAAYDYLYYQHNKAKKTDKNRTRRLRQLLVARSHLSETTPFSAPPNPPRPEQGHTSFRMTMGLGRDGEQSYQSVQLRPAYHDLMDPQAGYTPGAQINFLELSLRHQTENSILTLEHLKVIDIVSLAARDQFFQPFSWKLNTGLLRRPLDKHTRSLVYRTNGGAGLSYKPTANMLGYGFLETDIDLGGSLQDHYALGLGGRVGLFFDIGSRWRGHLYGTTQHFKLGHTQSVQALGLEQRFSLNQNHALHFQLGRRYFDQDASTSQIELNWHWYF